MPPNFSFLKVICIFGSLAMISSGCTSPDYQHPDLGAYDIAFVIDCDVPGSEIFLRGERLGTVPVAVPAGWCCSHAVNPKPAGSGGGTFYLTDSYGTALVLEDYAGHPIPLMLRVPDDRAHQFLSIETPWGRRTRMAGTGSNSESVNITPSPANHESGVEVSIDLQKKTLARNSAVPFKVDVAFQDSGTSSGEWSLWVHFISLDNPLIVPEVIRVRLPHASQSRRMTGRWSGTILIRAPERAGEYLVFPALFSEDRWVGNGATINAVVGEDF